MKKNSIQALCVSAILLAMSIGLSFVKIWTLPLGGSVTLLSMLPLCFVSIKYGLGWGLGAAFCYSWFQILQDPPFGWGLSIGMLLASLALDYIVAFTAIGLAGAFRRHGTVGMVLGVVMAVVLRFLSHFLSGVLLWANFKQFEFFGHSFEGRPVLYSLVYNGSYMLPELVMTVIGAALLLCIPQIRKLVEPVPKAEKQA